MAKAFSCEGDASKLASREGWVSIFGNTLLFVGKFYVGLVSNSVALVADAVHTLSDSISSIALLVGVHISRRPKDAEHPFGHGRSELIVTMFIGFLLAVVAFEFLTSAVEKLINRVGGNYGWAAIVITIISIVVKEAMAQYAFRIAKRTNYRSVHADGWHHRSDAISSVVVLAGVLCGDYFWWVDGVLGIVIALILFYASWTIIREAVNPLLGEDASSEMQETVREVCAKYIPCEIAVHHFHLHQYGSHAELTFHLAIRQPGISLNDAHDYTENIEEELHDRYNIHATIHLEPFREKAQERGIYAL